MRNFASKVLTDILTDEGFHVDKGVAGHETAFWPAERGRKMGLELDCWQSMTHYRKSAMLAGIISLEQQALQLQLH